MLTSSSHAGALSGSYLMIVIFLRIQILIVNLSPRVFSTKLCYCAAVDDHGDDDDDDDDVCFQ